MLRIKSTANQTVSNPANVRAAGAMVACELVKDREQRTPDADLAKALVAKANAKGLLLLSCGIFANTIRVLVPLTADDALIDEGLTVLQASLKEVLGAQQPRCS